MIRPRQMQSKSSTPAGAAPSRWRFASSAAPRHAAAIASGFPSRMATLEPKGMSAASTSDASALPERGARLADLVAAEDAQLVADHVLARSGGGEIDAAFFRVRL